MLQGDDLPVADAFGEALHPFEGVVVVEDKITTGLQPAGQDPAVLLLRGGEGVDGVRQQLVVVAVDQVALAGGADPFPAFGEEDVALAEGGGDEGLGRERGERRQPDGKPGDDTGDFAGAGREPAQRLSS